MKEKLPKVREELLDDAVHCIQIHYEKEMITLGQADSLIASLRLPQDWRRNLVHRSDRRTPATFLDEQTRTTRVQNCFMREYVRQAKNFGLDYKIEDSGCGNDGRWLVNPKNLAKTADYTLELSGKKFTCEVKWLKAFGFVTPKVEDLNSAISHKTEFTLFFFSMIAPNETYIHPDTRLGIMPLQAVSRMLELPHMIYRSEKSGLPIYGNKPAVRLYSSGSERYSDDKFPKIEDYFPVYPLSNLPREAFLE